VEAVDLHEGLDVPSASMADYAERVVTAASELPRPVALLGWSSGGLAVLMAATRAGASSVVLVESSAPVEVQGPNHDVDVADGVFDPEQVYGPFPRGIPARPESLRARGERKRGVSVPALSCRSLVVYGRDFADERGRRLAAFFGSDELSFPELDHWRLVLDPRVREPIATWLAQPA
jgi:pimeloyl-ACP methyl ester carboxylesterase